MMSPRFDAEQMMPAAGSAVPDIDGKDVGVTGDDLEHMAMVIEQDGPAAIERHSPGDSSAATESCAGHDVVHADRSFLRHQPRIFAVQREQAARGCRARRSCPAAAR